MRPDISWIYLMAFVHSELRDWRAVRNGMLKLYTGEV